jgi:hypothetical protein
MTPAISSKVEVIYPYVNSQEEPVLREKGTQLVFARNESRPLFLPLFPPFFSLSWKWQLRGDRFEQTEGQACKPAQKESKNAENQSEAHLSTLLGQIGPAEHQVAGGTKKEIPDRDATADLQRSSNEIIDPTEPTKKPR